MDEGKIRVYMASGYISRRRIAGVYWDVFEPSGLASL